MTREMGNARRGADRKSPRLSRRLCPALLIVMLLVVYGVLTPLLFAKAHLPFDSDEARHALNGLQVAADVLDARWGKAVTDVYFQEWYPPLLSLVLAPFMLALRPAYWSARYPMLLLLMLNIALIYRAGKMHRGRAGTGLIAALLVSTSAVAWMYGLLCMEEMLAMTGAMLVVLAWTAYHRLGVASRPGWIGWALGVSLAFTLMARTSSGVFAVGAVIAATWLGPEPWRIKAQMTWRAIGPVAVVAALWWGHPAKMRGLADYLGASSPAFATLTIRELAYYWQAMVTSYTVGPVVGVLVLVTTVAAVRRWRDPQPRLLLAFVIITWLGLMLKRQLNLRFFLNAVPMACLLAAQELSAVVAQLRRRGSVRLSIALASALGAYVILAFTLRAATLPFLMTVSYETEPATAVVHEWIADRVTDRPIFLVNGWDQFSAEALDFRLAMKVWPDWRSSTVTGVTLADPQEMPEAVDDFRDAVVSYPEAQIVHLGNAPVASAGAWWAYRAALRSCWNGSWEETESFGLHLWDPQLESLVLSQPLRYYRAGSQAAAREQLWYALPIEVGIATCHDE